MNNDVIYSTFVSIAKIQLKNISLCHYPYYLLYIFLNNKNINIDLSKLDIINQTNKILVENRIIQLIIRFICNNCDIIYKIFHQ